MCTLVILRRPDHSWPLVVAANRDEHRARPAREPGRHWPDRPETVAGLDLLGGGSWLGVNDHGLLAAVMNREGTLGPLEGKRSRGELVLEALDHAEAEAAAEALADLHPGAYRPFNVVVADPRSAYWIRHDGERGIEVHPIVSGLHLLSSTELDDPAHPRIAAYQARFAAAAVPDPESGDWAEWRALLGSRTGTEAGGAESAMWLEEREDGFGTRSSALIAVPVYPGFHSHILWLHAEGRADSEAFRSVM
ncbi:NRDE family protein [Thiorhodococcus fuscus]|uniref:NRDE family protein n=1 Tax=Thiorhodococcus fuscus TaxID=527200 RepID=A0ABW4Y6W7_9GAMM